MTIFSSKVISTARPQLEVWMILVQRLMQCHFIAMARSLLPCLAAHNEQWILSTCVKRHNDWCPLWMGQVCNVCVCCSSESQHLHKVSLSAENTSTHDCLNKHGYNCKSHWHTLECRLQSCIYIKAQDTAVPWCPFRKHCYIVGCHPYVTWWCYRGSYPNFAKPKMATKQTTQGRDKERGTKVVRCLPACPNVLHFTLLDANPAPCD